MPRKQPLTDAERRALSSLSETLGVPKLVGILGVHRQTYERARLGADLDVATAKKISTVISRLRGAE